MQAPQTIAEAVLLQEVVSLGMLWLVTATRIIAMQAVLLAVALHRINA